MKAGIYNLSIRDEERGKKMGRLSEKTKKQERFFTDKKKNSFLCGFTCDSQDDEFSSHILNEEIKKHFASHGKLPSGGRLQKIVENYVKQTRSKMKERITDDDFVPTLFIHTDSGCKIAGITDMTPDFLNNMFWLEPNLDYDQIEKIRFNPENPFINCLLEIYRHLVRLCDGDYLAMPYTHRSPLDLANAMRGTEIFVDMYLCPENVKWLTDKIVDMELEIQDLFYSEVKFDGVCKTGIHGIKLPDKSVWVNGDPVGLISREMMLEFEQPFTSRLFCETGGGYFHNHTVGLYQVDQVAKTKGVFLQQFEKDFNVPTLEEVMRKDEKMRQTIVEASLVTPIQIFAMEPKEIDEVLPLLEGGCFSLQIKNEDKSIDYGKILDKIRKFER